MIPAPLRVTIVQADLAWGDKKTNLDNLTRLLQQHEEETDLIILPEMFATGFLTEPEETWEPTDGEVMQWMSSMASTHNAVISSSIAIKENGKYYNRLVWMRPDGTYEKYDKRHLFSMGNEHEHFTPGFEPLIVELKGWKIKPLVCYDLRFPVWSKNRYREGSYEYDMLFYVASWPDVRRIAWQTLLAARAIENLSYCVGVNRVGPDTKGYPHSGGSVIHDYKGRMLTGCADNTSEAVTFELDYQSLKDFREHFNVGPDWDFFNYEV